MTTSNGKLTSARTVTIPEDWLLEKSDEKLQSRILKIQHENAVHIEWARTADGGGVVFKVKPLNDVSGCVNDNVERAVSAVLFDFRAPARIPIPNSIPHNLFHRLRSNFSKLEQIFNCHIIVVVEARMRPEVHVRPMDEPANQVIREIQTMLDEEASWTSLSIPVAAQFHPWIRGGFSKRIDLVKQKIGSGLKDVIFSAHGEVVVRGEPESCRMAQTMIEELHQHYRSSRQSIMSIELPKTIQMTMKHQDYFIWNKVFEETDVLVELPRSFSRTFKCDLIAYDNSKLTDALSLIHRLCNATVDEKVEIDPKMVDLVRAKLAAANSRIRVGSTSMKWEGDGVQIRGMRADVCATRENLEYFIGSLKKTYQEVSIPEMDEHCGFAAVGYRNEFADRYMLTRSVMVSYDAETKTVKVRGARANVNAVLQDLEPRLERIKNEVEEKVSVSRSYHRALIGPSGSVIRSLRREFRVDVSIPDIRDKQNDQVVVRGARPQVDACIARINEIVAEAKGDGYEQAINVKKEHHRVVIGKNGSTISEIRRNHNNVLIEVPPVDSESTEIKIRGVEADVESAKAAIQALVDTIDEIEFVIPAERSSKFIINKRLRNEFMSKCPDNVKVVLSDDLSIVRIYGATEDVQFFKKVLEDEPTRNMKMEELRMSNEIVKYIIAFDESRVFESSRRQLGVSIDTKTHGDKITITGSEEAIKKCVDDIKKVVDGVGVITEREIPFVEIVNYAECLGRLFSVRQFVVGLGSKLRVIIEPELKDGLVEKVRIFGRENDVELGASHLLKLADSWKNAVSIERELPEHLAKNVKANARQMLYPLEHKFGVLALLEDGILKVTGEQECCEQLIDELLDSEVIEKIIRVPSRFHPRLLGKRGAEVNRIKEESGILEIRFPPKGAGDDVVVRGSRASIEEAERIIDQSMQRRWSGSPRLEHEKIIKVPKFQHPLIIGRGGRTINELRRNYDVEIRVPQTRDDSTNESVVIKGSSAEQCELVASEIRRMLSSGERAGGETGGGGQFSKQVIIPPRSIPILIGTRGRAINQFKKNYHVTVKFNAFDEHPDVAVVSGASEQEVDVAIEALRDLAANNSSDNTGDFGERPNDHQQSPEHTSNRAPDLQDLNEFPVFRGT